ncbi:MAG TPA: hypothetical protein VFR81_06770 [Longimicrobium sp.]|nr:hypothetical protein [Longimicrobium sp.]
MRWKRAAGLCGAAALLASCEVARPEPRLADGLAEVDDSTRAATAAAAFGVPQADDTTPADPAGGDVTPGVPAVLGRWRGAHDEVELFASGRLLLHRGEYLVAGSYEFLEPGRMLIIYQNALAAVPPGDYRVAVTADSLRFCETALPARCIRYARIAAPGPERTARAQPADDGTAPRLAMPLRPEQYPPEARTVEAAGLLKQAYVLQQTYRAQHGRYAEGFEQLREVGWEPVPMRHFHPLEMVRSGERLCIVARPRAADLWPVHIDAQGKIARGDDC